ncbi:histidine phosphatase family protein [Paenibacillus sp. MMS18-CY102]|uniref:histidine phosphatase family protein n=1 Tax=Paenibacillus sp. MMS18-CY102 TaxID=2682849 RepID=UPI0013656C40|nr:histidine phosphatase family protein [Paenibacillus sp. MMS18-CY102]MWC30172.1 histidine phosphatase family protein [Paenibacillus sp. MMS18-CY102]
MPSRLRLVFASIAKIRLKKERNLPGSRQHAPHALPHTIGLVRHYPVQLPLRPRRCDAEQFAGWCDRYNSAAVKLPAFPSVGATEWDACLSSDMRRAVATAQHIYGEKGGIVFTNKLREIELAPFWNTRLRLPLLLWAAVARAAWYASHQSQPESKKQARTRAAALADQLMRYGGEKRVLLVSHGAFLLVLQRELRRRGYRGPRIMHASHGKPYIMKRAVG